MNSCCILQYMHSFKLLPPFSWKSWRKITQSCVTIITRYMKYTIFMIAKTVSFATLGMLPKQYPEWSSTSFYAPSSFPWPTLKCYYHLSSAEQMIKFYFPAINEKAPPVGLPLYINYCRFGGNKLDPLFHHFFNFKEPFIVILNEIHFYSCFQSHQ